VKYNYAYLVYLCANCSDWHARWHGYVTDSGKVATALRLLGEAHQEAGAATDCGLLVLWSPEGRTGEALTIFGAGEITRAHRLAGADLHDLERRLDFGDEGGVLAQITNQGDKIAFVDTDWARVLRHLLTGNDDYPFVDEVTPMDLDQIRKLMGGL